MAEWLNAAVLKTVVRDERTVGSNPTPAARIAAHFYGDGDYENQSWQSEETTIWKCTQCWQRGRFAKPLGRRNATSEVGTHHFRHAVEASSVLESSCGGTQRLCVNRTLDR